MSNQCIQCVSHLMEIALLTEQIDYLYAKIDTLEAQNKMYKQMLFEGVIPGKAEVSE